MRVAIHQPNFVPWLPFFYKMAMSDKFILYTSAQFEKNGYQNRFKYKDKWITKPVKHGLDPIYKKEYVDGNSLVDLNVSWISTIKDTLDIEADIVLEKNYDYPDGDATDRLIFLLLTSAFLHNWEDQIVYVTNPEAKDKYLDEAKMISRGIAVEYCNVPKDLNISIFEAFDKFGIDGTKRQLRRASESCRV